MKTLVLAMLAAAVLPPNPAGAQTLPDVGRYLKEHGLRSVDDSRAAVLPQRGIAALHYYQKGRSVPSCGILLAVPGSPHPSFIDLVSSEDGDNYPQCLGIGSIRAFTLEGRERVVVDYESKETREDHYRSFFYLHEDGKRGYRPDDTLNRLVPDVGLAGERKGERRRVDGIEAARTAIRKRGRPESTAIAALPLRSAANDFSDNPFVALGVNPATGVVTGYVSVLRTAPGRTDACKFVFSGTLSSDGPVRLAIRDAVPENSHDPAPPGGTGATLTVARGQARIALPKTQAPGDCDWILGDAAGDRIVADNRAFVISLGTATPGDWLGVVAIGSRRAYFHDAPDQRSVRKAYLVRGDVAYVMAEQPGWYRVRFTHASKPSTGWIRAADTIQP